MVFFVEKIKLAKNIKIKEEKDYVLIGFFVLDQKKIKISYVLYCFSFVPRVDWPSRENPNVV